MLLKFLAVIVLVLGLVSAEDPYRFFDWNVTYGDIYPLGVRQQVCNFHTLVLCAVIMIFDHIFIKCLCFIWLICVNFNFCCRGFLLMVSFRGRKSIPSPMTTLLSMSTTACRSPSSFHGRIFFQLYIILSLFYFSGQLSIFFLLDILLSFFLN